MRNYKFIISCIVGCLLAFTPLASYAQTMSVSGTVSDTYEVTMPGVSVVVKNQNRGTITDENGKYVIDNLKAGDVLEFFFIGMHTVQKTVAASSVIDVVMKVDAIGLEDAVVTGYTYTKRKDITGSVASINSETIQKIPAYDITQSLVGVAGIRVNGSDIRIRGTRSKNASNAPLIILDGIPYEESLTSITPSDIESMQVLKDASSTAIYGAKGANGVILITTKQAAEGKTNISYDGFVGMGVNNYGTLDVMNAEQYIAFIREANRAAGTWNSTEDDASVFYPDEYANLGNMDTDWFGGYFEKKRLWHNHNLTITSSTKKIQTKLAFNYKNRQGRYKGDHDDLFYVTADFSVKLFPFLKVGTSNRLFYGNNWNKPDMTNNFVNMSPLTAIRNEDGSYNEYPFDDNSTKNPYMNETPGVYENNVKDWKLTSRVFANVNIIDGLTFTTNFSYSPSFTMNGIYYDKRSVSYAQDVNYASLSNNRKNDWVWNNILSYKKEFGKHSIDATLVYEMQNRVRVNSSMSGNNQESPKYLWYNLARMTESKNISSSFVRSQMVSVVARLQYSFASRYIITASVREDGASQLSSSNRWATFPSVAAAWRIVDENFVKDNAPWISDLKLRASYGMTGNYSIAAYSTLGSLYSTYANFGFGGITHRPGLEPSTRPTPHLGWEKNRMLDIGLDFGFLDNRIYGTIEYYDSRSYDLLYLTKLPYTTGYNKAWENVGDTRNHGFEFTLSTVPVQTKDAFLNINLSLFRNIEQLVKLQRSDLKVDLGNKLFVGYPVTGVYYDYKQLGIWQENEADLAALYGQKPGEVKVADLDGNGIIDEKDKMILGVYRPDISASLTISAEWKNIDFSIDLYGEFGGMDYDGRQTGTWTTGQGKHNTYNVDYWTPENPGNRHPRPIKGQTIKYISATGYYGNSYLNIRNITLGYTLPAKWMGNVMKSARFYLTTNNPIGWSQFRAQGGMRPWESFYIFGVNLKF